MLISSKLIPQSLSLKFKKINAYIYKTLSYLFQLVNLHIFPGHAFYIFGVYTPWSVNLPHQIGKQLTVPSLAVYAYALTVDCVLFSVSPLSLALAYLEGGSHHSLDLES